MRPQMTEEPVFNPFPGDSYDTPEKVKTNLFDLLCFKTRLSFYIRNFHVFYKSGKASATGYFTQNMQTQNSWENLLIAESCGGKVHLRGLNYLDDPRPAVIISNHMSLLETAVMHSFIRPRRDFCFVIKQQLFDVPYFGNIMRHLECIGVGRDNPKNDLKAVMEEGEERLSRGKSVIIFPQSSRTSVFDPAHFNTIGVKLAKRANVPVIPCALRTDFLQNGKLIKDLGPIKRNLPIHFTFGEPMEVVGNGKETHEAIIEFIKKNLREWGCSIEGE